MNRRLAAICNAWSAKQRKLFRFWRERRAEVNAVDLARRPVINGDDEWPCAAHRSGEPCQIFEAQRLMSPGEDQAVDGLGAETGNAQQFIAARLVHVDRKTAAMAQRPRKLRIDVEVEHAAGQVCG